MLLKTYLKTKSACKVKFTVNGAEAEVVELFGINNNWENPITLAKKKDGSFSVEVSLPKESRHEFKYRLNNTTWITEPEADGEAPDGFGSNNSVLIV